MHVEFNLGGSTLFSAKLDHVPQIGTKVTFRTDTGFKGYQAGTLIRVTVGLVYPPEYHLNRDEECFVVIAADDFEVLE